MCISFHCPSCQKRLKAPKTSAGQKAHCPKCKEVVTIPQAPANDAPPAPASKTNEPDDGYSLQSSVPESVLVSAALYKAEIGPPVQMSSSKVIGRSPPDSSSSDGDSSQDSLAESLSLTGRWWYYLFAFTLIPLVVSLLVRGDNIAERFSRTFQQHPEIESQLQQFDHYPSMKEIISLLPEGKLEGAHLSANTWWHWVYAAEAAVIFAVLLLFLFPCGNTTAKQAFLIASATATGGIIFLLSLQFIAAFTPSTLMMGGGVFFIIVGILNIIAFSYSAAIDPHTSFLLSFIGFTLGVGLCKELTKALPVFFHVRSKNSLNWQGVCYWGLASGIGFGLAEGIIYCSDFYNGIAAAGAYVTRFFSCVALHAIWSSAAALMIWRCKQRVESAEDQGFFLVMLWVLLMPMLLHGLYDTCLKREMHVAALVTALVSFGWLIFLIELARIQEKGSHRLKEV